MAITQIIATLPAVLNDSETFYEDIAIRNNSLVATVLPSINTWATQANTTQTEINAKVSEASASATSAATSATTATTKASEASASATSALGYKNDVSGMKLAVETIYDTFEARFSVIDTVDDFETVPSGIDTVIVKDLNRGGTFTYDATQSAINNGGTIFDGWVRQYSGAVNVKWFGAVGDGVTDDTVAITTALIHSKNIVIKDGDFCGSFINIPSNTTITGYSSRMLPVNNSNNYAIFSINSDSSTSFIEKVTIEGLVFYGKSDTLLFSEFEHCFRVNGGSNIHIKNCRFEAFRGDGLYIGSGDIGGQERHNKNISVTNCTFDGINKQNRNGISIVDGTDIIIDSCSFVRTTISGMPGAIDIEPDNDNVHIVDGVTVSNCSFLDIGEVGSNVTALSVYCPPITNLPRNITFDNNTFRDCKGGSIGVTMLQTPVRSSRSNNIKILNNKGYNGEITISLNGIKDCLVSGNSFTNYTKAMYVGNFEISTYLTNKVYNLKLQNNNFQTCGSTAAGAVEFYKVEELDIIGNLFDNSGSLNNGQIFFGGSEINRVSIRNNTFDTSNGVVTKVVWRYAATFYAMNKSELRDNIFKGSSLSYLDFPAYKTDVLGVNSNVFLPSTPPNDFDNGKSITFLNSPSGGGLPLAYTQGVLVTNRAVTQLGSIELTTQEFMPRGTNSVETFYRYAIAEDNAWSSWKKITAVDV